MGSNPSRTVLSRSCRDQMIATVAGNLVADGCFVLADHVNWRNGAPTPINGHTPDIIAEKGDQRLVFEVEDCATYADRHTRDQLSAFARARGCQVRVVVPAVCHGEHSRPFAARDHMLLILGLWGLGNRVGVAVCDPSAGTVAY